MKFDVAFSDLTLCTWMGVFYWKLFLQFGILELPTAEKNMAKFRKSLDSKSMSSHMWLHGFPLRPGACGSGAARSAFEKLLPHVDPSGWGSGKRAGFWWKKQGGTLEDRTATALLGLMIWILTSWHFWAKTWDVQDATFVGDWIYQLRTFHIPTLGVNMRRLQQ